MKRARDLEEQEAARYESKKLKKQLFTAIIQRDIEAVRQLLRRAPLLVQRHTGYGAAPLGLAAAVGDLPLVTLLLDEGGDVAEGDHVGATPLIAAAGRGHTEVCLQLLSSKQGGNRGRDYLLRQTTRRAGEVALHAAAKGGHVDTMQALLAAGADPAAVDREGRDCFIMAAANDHPNAMSHLLQNHGASPNRADGIGRTALMHAAASGAVQAVHLLLSLEPSLELSQADHRGYGPLHYACIGGSVEVVEALTRRGLSLDPAAPQSLLLLQLACRSGHEAVVEWMLESGVGLAELVADGAANPMYAAVRGGSTAVLDVLLAHGARLETRDSKGRTPLGVAAEGGDTPLCRHLVAAGADLRAADNHGRVPRRLAYLANKRDTAQALSGMARLRLVVADDVIDQELLGEMDAEAQRQDELPVR